jgi:redox-sensing transcriptional repressor
LNYLKSLPKDGAANISATMIAEALRLNDVQVRKDLALVSDGGRPKIGYNIEVLTSDIEHCLGYDNVDSAVLIGAGNLGRALLAHEGFSAFGLDIIAAFDIDENIIGTTVHGKQVLPVNKVNSLCSRMKIKIGIITVRAEAAQSVCDLLVESGVLAIWNFAPVHLKVPEKVLVQNENMASSLAILSNHLVERLNAFV